MQVFCVQAWGDAVLGILCIGTSLSDSMQCTLGLLHNMKARDCTMCEGNSCKAQTNSARQQQAAPVQQLVLVLLYHSGLSYANNQFLLDGPMRLEMQT